MRRYLVTFWGRTVGAIGVCSRYTVEVQADTEEAAILRVYDTHEHLSSVVVREVTP